VSREQTPGDTGLFLPLQPDAQAPAPVAVAVEPTAAPAPDPPQRPPIPAPRRSTRDRRPPHWQTTGEYVMSQQARYDLLQQILDKL
jgi:hypothetical protein